MSTGVLRSGPFASVKADRLDPGMIPPPVACQVSGIRLETDWLSAMAPLPGCCGGTGAPILREESVAANQMYRQLVNRWHEGRRCIVLQRLLRDSADCGKVGIGKR